MPEKELHHRVETLESLETKTESVDAESFLRPNHLETEFSQEEAEEEARAIIQRLKESLNTGAVVEKNDEKLEPESESLKKIKRAVEALTNIAREHSKGARGFREELQLALKAPREMMVKTKATWELKSAAEGFREALSKPEERLHALRLLGEMVNGMYGNMEMYTSYREVSSIAKKLLGSAIDALYANEDLLLQELDVEEQKELLRILSGVSKYYYRGGDTHWKKNPKMESFYQKFSDFFMQQLDALKKDPDQERAKECTYACMPLMYKDGKVDNQFRDLLLEFMLLEKEGVSDLYKYREAFLQVVESLGIDPKRFYDADKNTEGMSRDNFNANFRAIIDIERGERGAVKKLWEEYGILTFARYPKELLLKQLSQESDMEHPYGVIFYPREDWNGAFYTGKYALEELPASSDKLGVNIRVFECEGRLDMVKKLVRLDRTYGKKQKIKFALIGGHGDKSSLQFAPDFAMAKEINKGNIIYSKALPELRGLFDSQATVILNSCSTGTDDGIGQTLSKMANIHVIAPDANCGLRKFAIGQEEDNLTFEVEYSGSAYPRVFRSKETL